MVLWYCYANENYHLTCNMSKHGIRRKWIGIQGIGVLNTLKHTPPRSWEIRRKWIQSSKCCTCCVCCPWKTISKNCNYKIFDKYSIIRNRFSNLETIKPKNVIVFNLYKFVPFFFWILNKSGCRTFPKKFHEPSFHH